MSQGFPSNKQLGKLIEKSASETGVSVRRQRRWVAVIALVEVFSIGVSRGIIPAFLVKGGFAIELRFQHHARSSRDVDIVIPLDPHHLLDAAIEVLRLEWSGFSFRIKGQLEQREHSFKFELNALYQGREWSTFEVELVFGQVGAEDRVAALDFSTYGLLQPSPIPCMTAVEQIAQKLHAVSDPNENRPRDLIDIYLLDKQLNPNGAELLAMGRQTFDTRGTHPWPPNIEIRDGWMSQLSTLIVEAELTLNATQVVYGVFSLLSRLTGITMAQNYQYHFVILQASTSVPNAMSNAIDQTSGGGYEIFKRMTEQEGWRLAQMMRYPSGGVTSAILAVLEKPLPD